MSAPHFHSRLSLAMLDLATLLPDASHPAHFTTIVCFRSSIFGMITWPDRTCLLLGDEVLWLPVPSWATIVGFIFLAWLEYRLLRALRDLIRHRFGRCKVPTPMQG